MFNNKVNSKEGSVSNKIWQYIRKDGFTILMVFLFGILLLNPNAKSFLIRQLMVTGIFNARISKKNVDTAKRINVDFDYSDEKGNIQNTSSLRGKVVFINFWASWCPPCRAEFPSIQTLYSKFKNNADVVFLIINEDNDLSLAKAYLYEENFSIPILKSNGNVPAEIYSGTLPTTIVLDKNGKIRYHETGFANYAADKFVKQIAELIRE